ncbi:hypothetical protein K227x_15590 [Rubripirellula lacrimiformis]|uniref:DUF3500 domain-containing protein n=1 Tax=Rubripirellula lacrimiformis TaxID=1930273 RepID=A0A517N7Q9_9BACT|nr:DUF3500 domain-containing protein [Rubripirellula lacrimiformis]QDT03177.1 hypothetical protein K227x_15590 [Rubripirellula lacrimiformis]
MRFAVRSLVVLVICVSAFAVAGLKVGDPPGMQMQSFAEAFVASLDSDQKAKAMLPYDSDARVDWHFIPKKTRKGLVLRDMDVAQRTAALRLVRAALSEAGYDKTNKIMINESVLFKLEGDKRNWDRDPNKYYITLFGQPSNTGAWGLSFEGHHLSLNFVCRDGKMVDSTPQFFAANPATIMDDVDGPLGKGTRILKQEEDLAFQLIGSLSGEKLDAAVIAEDAPKEIRFAGEAQPAVGNPEGIPFGKLDPAQRKLLRELVSVYVDAVADDIAEQRRELIEASGWENVYFAWAGAKEPGIGHYYRVRGNDFLIEFVNTQPDASGNPANHIHAVWRDLTGDFDLPIK